MYKQMKFSVFNNSIILGTFFLFTFSPSPFLAEEKIIDEKKMSFDRCVNVIKVSIDKLSIIPEIINLSENKRSAVFTMSDGTLTITCDGDMELVTVSSETN